MRDYITIGSSPWGEDCAQVGRDNYRELAKKECRAFINQLRRRFGNEPEGASFSIKSFPHDFGSYHEVVVNFDDENERATDYAYEVENMTPELWDEEAKKELGFTFVLNKNETMVQNSGKGTSDRYYIDEENNMLLYWNHGLDYVGIETFDFENKWKYDFYHSYCVSEDFEDKPDFWEMGTEEMLSYLCNIVPWTEGECMAHPIKLVEEEIREVG